MIVAFRDVWTTDPFPEDATHIHYFSDDVYQLSVVNDEMVEVLPNPKWPEE